MRYVLEPFLLLELLDGVLYLSVTITHKNGDCLLQLVRINTLSSEKCIIKFRPFHELFDHLLDFVTITPTLSLLLFDLFVNLLKLDRLSCLECFEGLGTGQG